MSEDCLQLFADVVARSGLVPPPVVIPDGRIHRFSSSGRTGDHAGWYVLHSKPIFAGAYGCWRNGLCATWRIEKDLTPEESEALLAAMRSMRDAKRAEDARLRGIAVRKAREILRASRPASHHPYLEQKRIRAHGARLYQGSLVIPLRIGNELHSLQFISSAGEKKFLFGGRVSGCYFAMRGEGPLCVVEGFATGAAIAESMGTPVAVAFSAQNLAHAARELRARFRGEILICGDRDARGEWEGREAASAIGATLILPDREGTDFNDIFVEGGVWGVRNAFKAVRP